MTSPRHRLHMRGTTCLVLFGLLSVMSGCGASLTGLARQGDTDGVKEALTSDLSTQDLNRALVAAVANSHTEITELLLEFGADPDATDVRGKSCLLIATGSNNRDLVTVLLANGADMESVDFTIQYAIPQIC